jgi:hypothetical protein
MTNLMDLDSFSKDMFEKIPTGTKLKASLTKPGQME